MSKNETDETTQHDTTHESTRHGTIRHPNESTRHDTTRRKKRNDADDTNREEIEHDCPFPWQRKNPRQSSNEDPLMEREKRRDHTRTEEKEIGQCVVVVDSREDDGLKLHRTSLL
jgi:hypothetical protein